MEESYPSEFLLLRINFVNTFSSLRKLLLKFSKLRRDGDLRRRPNFEIAVINSDFSSRKRTPRTRCDGVGRRTGYKGEK